MKTMNIHVGDHIVSFSNKSTAIIDKELNHQASKGECVLFQYYLFIPALPVMEKQGYHRKFE
jgi:hypothetical protein